MPPKRKQASTTSKSKSASASTIKRAKTSKIGATKPLQKLSNSRRRISTPNYNEESDPEPDDDDFYVLQSQPSSQTILGRSNRLNDLLSSQNNSQKKNTNPRPKKKPETKSKASKSTSSTITSNTKKRNSGRPFEEDDGFVYKRSQSTEDNGHESDKKKRKQISTPVTQLNEELNNMSREIDNNEEIQLLDLQEFKRRNKANVSTGNKKRNGQIQIEKPVRKYNFLDESSFQLSSPIKDQRQRDGYSSDEYVEQVSHHRINLTEEPKPRNPSNRKNDKRRSSYYNRGKRVSSIGNGFVAEPHHDVSPRDYFKLLDTSLPEPDRMRQLLIWCFKKKMDQVEKELKSKNVSPEEQTINGIAGVVKGEILQKLMDKQISISWYSIPDEIEAYGKEVTVKNPLNVSNLRNIDIYTKKLKSLIKQKQKWQESYERAIKPIANLSVSAGGDANVADIKKYIKSKPDSRDQSLDLSSSVLDSSLIDKINSNFEEVNSEIKNGLETSIDRLYHTSYQMEKSSELVEAIQSSKLNTEVSNLLHDYMNKTSLPNYRILRRKSQKDHWPLPSSSVDTRDILRTLTRLEKPEDN
ncbi:Mis12-Mtw1 protein family-domain-containing protein [Scheffersomyces xylosifermentans]|uniref:Mis12-Mtw1 protein family-domain-containing protein n=1 Tax=Scheffersomyces xylosifermentans TaxID=1304137 RepID=UPI00315C73A8